MPISDAARFSLIAAIILIVLAACVIGVFACVDYFGEKSRFDDNGTAVSSMTGSDIGSTPSTRRKRRVRIEEDATEASSLLDDGAQIKTDKALMDTFVLVLTQGMKLKMYYSKDGKAPKDVKLELVENGLLQWTNANRRSGILGMVQSRPKNVKITDVKTIEWGKRTATFQGTATNQPKDEDCFSLVLENGVSLDFETTSKVERDSLAQGFTILINNMNQNQLA